MWPGLPQTWPEWAAAVNVAAAVVALATWGCVLWNGIRHRMTHRMLRALRDALDDLQEAKNGDRRG